MKRYLPLLALFFAACTIEPSGPPGTMMAYVPIYQTTTVYNDINVQGPQPTINAGKIYAYGSYLFQVDQQRGIHIIDNSTPAQAHKIAFLNVPLCSEIAIKQSQLYTNNLNDLVVFDLTDITAPKLVKRLEKAFPLIDQQYPQLSNIYFECPDTTKGVVVGWEQKMIAKPDCRR
jgi:hypothetical protein